MNLHKRSLRAGLCSLLAVIVLAGGVPPVAVARIDRKPVIISFGKPNIWSLEQAHYLLARMHERSRDLATRAPSESDLDPNATNGTRVNTVKSLLEAGASFQQQPSVSGTPSATPSGTPQPAPVPSPSFDASRFPEGVVDKLLEDEEFRNELRRDVRLAATTVLDNHIQMQYEIIAKQLTLLRDEVAHDERLVFLELPQSIYTTPSKADGKVAQAWWRVSGVEAELPEDDFNYSSPTATAQGIREKDAPPVEQNEVLGQIRTVDLIPRQSSLNVNDIQDTIKAGALTAAFSFLFGFGAKVNYQRQRELYEQYIHQEIFASGFGKGSRDFGWTFGPLPGSKRVAPGIRTTYAVMVIPSTVTKLRFTAAGCYFPRKRNAPTSFDDVSHADWTEADERDDYQCETTAANAFTVSVPNGRDDSFFVTEAWYQPAAPGQRVSVHLRGRDFSTLTGVLVNGVSLCPSVGVAQPVLGPRRCPPAPTDGRSISGEFERLNRRQLVLTFRMPDDFRGIPTITVVAPSRAIDINRVPLRVNNAANELLLNGNADVPFMFGRRPQEGLTLTGLDISRAGPSSTTVTAVLSGTRLPKPFDPSAVELRVNDQAAVCADPRPGACVGPVGAGPVRVLRVEEGFYQLAFTLPRSDTIDVSLIRGDEFASRSFANPSRLQISEVTVLGFERRGRGTVLTLKLRGTGFGENPQVTVEGVTRRAVALNSGEAVVELNDPPSVVVLTVTNPVTNASVTTAVARPTPREP